MQYAHYCAASRTLYLNMVGYLTYFRQPPDHPSLTDTIMRLSGDSSPFPPRLQSSPEIITVGTYIGKRVDARHMVVSMAWVQCYFVRTAVKSLVTGMCSRRCVPNPL